MARKVASRPTGTHKSSAAPRGGKAGKKPAAKPGKKAPAPKAKPAKKAPAPKAKPAKKAPAPKAKPAKKALAPKAKPVAAPSTIRLAAMLRLLPPMADVRKSTAAELDALRPRVPSTLVDVWAELGWGRFGNGFLQLASPTTLDGVLSEWLGKKDETRTPLGWTGLGDIIYFRDLRERARALGTSAVDAENACDVSVIDVRYKQVKMLAWSLDGFFEGFLGDESALRSELHKELFDAALSRLGPPGVDEIYGFVPALALGGAEDPANLERVGARVHLDILRQL